MRKTLVLVLILGVLMAGCMSDDGTPETGEDGDNLTVAEVIDMAEDQRDIYEYIQAQDEPRATFNYWRWSAIEEIGQGFQCYDQLESGTDYYRVSIFGDQTVMDVWMTTEEYSIHCSTELGQQQAEDENIDDAGSEPIDTSNGDEENRSTDGGGDLGLSITGNAPTGSGTLVYLSVASTFEESVQATIEYPDGSKTVDIAPGDNAYSIETTATGNVTFSILQTQDSDPANNEDLVTIPSDDGSGDGTNNTTTDDGTGGTNGTEDSNDTTTGDGPSFNLWVNVFDVTPTDPEMGEEINFGLEVESDDAVPDVEVAVLDKQGNTVRSDRININGTRILSFNYPYDGEDGFVGSIDPSDEYNETDETDNDETVDVTQSGSGDVAVTGVSTDPSDPHDQENTTLVADLSSDGYSGDVTVTFTWDGSSVGSETVSISSGVSTSAETYHVVSSGSHDLKASISLDDNDTTNNDAATTVDVADYQTFELNWEQSLGGDPLNLPHSSGTLYTMAAGTVTALDAGSGDLLWETSTGHNVEDTMSPILANGRLFYGENEGNQAVGFSISDQSVDWTYKTGYSVRSGAAYKDGTVFMGSDDGSMYAYGATDGSVQWNTGGGELRAAPTVAGSTVYIPEWSGTVYARSTGDGSQQWSQGLGDSIEQSKPYVDSSRVYIGALDGNLYALDRSTGSIDWTFDTGGGVKSSPTKSNGMIVVGGGGGTIYSVWATNGTKAWEYQTSSTGSINAHPAIANATVYIGSPSGMFYGLDLATGEKTCEYNTGTGSIRTKPTVVGDAVYIGTTSNQVFSFEACPS